jgi:hypothetical protein
MKGSTGPRPTAHLSKSVSHQLNSYALAASAAGVSLLALAQPAEAKIVYTRAHTKIPAKIHVGLSLTHDGVRDLSFFWGSYSSIGSLGFRVYPVESKRVIGYQGIGRSVFCASALTSGVVVGPKDDFMPPRGGRLLVNMWVGFVTDGNGTDSYGRWRDVERGYLGVKFSDKGKTHYGWVRLNVKETKIGDGIDAVITGYAYETIPNKPIIAGQTKDQNMITAQPASLGHLARGASAIPAWRAQHSAH